MASDLYAFDSSFYQHSSPEMLSSDGDYFFSDPFSPFCDSANDVLQELSNSQTPLHDYNTIDNFGPSVVSSSLPSHQLENLSLCQTTTATLLQPAANSASTSANNSSSLANGYGNFYDLDGLEVKIEECQVGFDYSYNHHHQQQQQQSFLPHSYSEGVENVAKTIQRTYSSNSFDGKPGDFFFHPCFDTLMESPEYQSQAFSSPESSFLAGHMRRVCSTGDLQNIRTAHTTQRSFSSSLAAESSFAEEANFKVGRYSAEERKERISKYRAKRNQRNFNKTIKYACRKTLADNRPRIRGRFARNEEIGETPKAAGSTRDEDEDELWFDGLQEEEDDGAMRGTGGAFVNSCGQAQFQYYNYGY